MRFTWVVAYSFTPAAPLRLAEGAPGERQWRLHWDRRPDRPSAALMFWRVSDERS